MHQNLVTTIGWFMEALKKLEKKLEASIPRDIRQPNMSGAFDTAGQYRMTMADQCVPFS